MITVTMEKTIRVSKKFDPTPEQMDAIMKDGANPFFDDMMKKFTEAENDYLHTKQCDGDVEYDYTIVDNTGKTLVDWD